MSFFHQLTVLWVTVAVCGSACWYETQKNTTLFGGDGGETINRAYIHYLIIHKETEIYHPLIHYWR